jgi:hypothetical protein
VVPLLTQQNNAAIAIGPVTRENWTRALRSLLIDHWFTVGVVAAWVLWFMSFHSPLAWLVELSLIIVLVAVLLVVYGITRRPLFQWRDRITFLVAALGLICFLWRLIDAGVRPHGAAELAAHGESPVLFYHRLGWLLDALFGWELPTGSLGCFVAGVPRGSLLLIGLIAVVLGWLASRNEGRRGKVLFVIAALVGLPVVGIVAARALTPAGSLCAVASEEAEPGETGSADTSADLGASPSESETSLGPTRIAGTHPPNHVCSYVSGAHASVCPGRAAR